MNTEHQLPQGYYMRPAAEGDIDRLTDMLNEYSLWETGVADQDANELRDDWQTPGFDPQTDTWLILTSGDQIVGYVDIWDISETHTASNLWGRVHPDHHNRGLGCFLMERGEERARQIITKAPADARVILKTFTVSTNESAQALCETMGYKAVRNFFRMVIEMDTLPPAPIWPDGITVHSFVPGQDDVAAYEAYEESFSDHWGHLPMEFDRWIHLMTTFEDFDPSLWFLAMDGEQIAGMSLCRPKITEDPDMGWLSILGVRRLWRRQGLGLALLHHTFGEFYRRGTLKVGLGVDAQSLTGATRLYERAGMHTARSYVFFEKELRPGRDLAIQTLEEESQTA